MMHKQYQHAFTLVELLVTIAVIGLLLSILMPALGRARDEAKLTVCKARLRTVCSAALMYADENNSNLPLDDTLGPSFFDKNNNKISNPHTALIESLSNYVQSGESYYCPSEKHKQYSYSPENLTAGEIGYFYFSCKNNPFKNSDISTFLRWPQMGVISYPRHLRSDMHPQTWVISDLWFSGQPTAHQWCKKGVNYALLDSSVQMLYKQPRQQFR